jgi:hypothetical protein
MRPYYLDGDLAQHDRAPQSHLLRDTLAVIDLAGPGDTRYRPPLIDGGRFVASVQFSRTVERR